MLQDSVCLSFVSCVRGNYFTNWACHGEALRTPFVSGCLPASGWQVSRSQLHPLLVQQGLTEVVWLGSLFVSELLALRQLRLIR